MPKQTTTRNPHSNDRVWTSSHDCAVCGSKAIGINFGAPTCAPCKAFFRRNARRKEILQMPCHKLNSESAIGENEDQYDPKDTKNCSQLRRCTTCRLHRCFDVGMKEESLRTDAEKQRYKQLIEINRQRRREILGPQEKSEDHLLSLPPVVHTNTHLLTENDWTLLSNIVYAYDNYCLKILTENRKHIFTEAMRLSGQVVSKVDHHIATRVNTITSYLSFLFSIPAIRSLSSSTRLYLCKHNVRPLIILNSHEIDQTCFSESWQLEIDNTVAKHVYGEALYSTSIRVKNQAESILINDPAVTRLWLLILFFSTSLSCYYDRSLPEMSKEARLDQNQVQGSLTLLLWNYLLHRHGYVDAVRIFSNLIRVYLRMQRFSQAIGNEVRTRPNLAAMNQAFSRAIVFEKDI